MTAIAAFALGNWRWLLPALIAIGLGATVGVQHIRIVELKATIATTTLNIEKQKTEAAEKLAASEKRVREIEARNAELVAAAQEKHDHDQADIIARDRRISDLLAANGGLRIKAAGCGPSGGDVVPGTAAGAGVPSQSSAGLECRLPASLSNEIHGDYRDAADLVVFAQACLKDALALHAKP